MNMQQLQYALEIEKCGSINKAAQNLYISQPALSRALHELENEIGITLFHRTKSGITLTHQGEEFLARARHLNEQFVSFQNQYYDKRKKHILNLSVASSRYAIVERAFTNFYNQHEHYELQNLSISEFNAEDVLYQVYDGRFTLGVILISSDEKAHWKHKAGLYNLTWETLSIQPSYIQVGMQHPLAQKQSVCIEELKDYPHATMAASDVSSILSCSDIRGYDEKRAKKRILVNDKSMMYEILTHTNAFYIGVNLEALAPKNGQICYLPIEDTDVTIEIALLHLETHKLTKTEQSFIEELKKLL